MFYMLFCAVEHQKDLADCEGDVPVRMLRPMGAVSIAFEFASAAGISAEGLSHVQTGRKVKPLCTDRCAELANDAAAHEVLSRVESCQEADEIAQKQNQNSSTPAIERDIGGETPAVETSKVRNTHQERRQGRKASREWRDRVVWGTCIGLAAAWAVVAGGWWFSWAIAITGMGGAWEYFKLVNLRAERRQETAPPQAVAQLCCALCLALPLITMYCNGRVGWALPPFALVAVLALLVQRPTSRHLSSQLSSVLFGLVYCGYLPSFWIKVRFGLSPFDSDPLLSPWRVPLEGMPHGSIGSMATFLAFATVVAADSFAYIGGKAFGRTQLCSISPKKTWEGAVAGLLASVLITLGLARLLHWPWPTSSVTAMAVLVFLTSVLGDLYESRLKRDAGAKDSGTLIPGHGGILDRIDSYIFTGAIVFWFIDSGIPLVAL